MSLQWTAWLAAMTRKGRILYTLRIKGKSELKEGSVWSTNIKLFHFFYDYSYSSTFQQSSSSQVKTEAPLISILSPQSVCPQQQATCCLF